MRLRSHLISPFFLIAFPLYPSVCLAWKLPQQHLWFRFAPSAPGFQRKPGLSPGALLAMSGPILDGSGNGLDKPPLRVSSQNPGVSSEDGVKLFSGPASRNMGPILEVFKGILPTDTKGSAISIAEGSGMHVENYAQAYPGMVWKPSDIDPAAIASINAYCSGILARLGNVRDAVIFNTMEPAWEAFATEDDEGPCKLLYVVNLCHISPWGATEGLFAAADKILSSNGHLCIYGPFKLNGEFTSDGNRDFDQSLRNRDATWGIRDIKEVEELGRPLGFALEKRYEMPANNFLLHFRKP